MSFVNVFSGSDSAGVVEGFVPLVFPGEWVGFEGVPVEVEGGRVFVSVVPCEPEGSALGNRNVPAVRVVGDLRWALRWGKRPRAGVYECVDAGRGVSPVEVLADVCGVFKRARGFAVENPEAGSFHPVVSARGNAPQLVVDAAVRYAAVQAWGAVFSVYVSAVEGERGDWVCDFSGADLWGVRGRADWVNGLSVGSRLLEVFENAARMAGHAEKYPGMWVRGVVAFPGVPEDTAAAVCSFLTLAVWEYAGAWVAPAGYLGLE